MPWEEGEVRGRTLPALLTAEGRSGFCKDSTQTPARTAQHPGSILTSRMLPVELEP